MKSKRQKAQLNKNKKKLHLIIKEVLKMQNPSFKKIHTLLLKYPKSNNSFFRKGEIIKEFKKLRVTKEINITKDQESTFLQAMQMKKTRTISGVAPVTVFTKPFKCPGQCIYCPTEENVPKSYLKKEPGVQRALRNFYDPYLQTFNRLVALNNIGHSTDKVELIILGGTFTAYPKKYLIMFLNQCFKALNDFNKNQDYHSLKSKQKKQHQKISLNTLFKNQQINEKANSRSVGISIETRPDEINEKTVIFLRKLGVTKIQLGVQSLSDKVLKLNKRGHKTAEIKKAFELLRLAGLKIQIHWMANLYGSSPKEDTLDYQKLFKIKFYRPDEVKIYPCSLIKSAKLMDYYSKDLWKPYKFQTLINILKKCTKSTPAYCRITRMIRDISASDIVVGNVKSNLRQIVEKELGKEKVKIREIRFREIRDKNILNESIKIAKVVYSTSVSNEIFIQFISKNNNIAGFLRLSLPTKKPFIKELEASAIIRELHIYGPSIDIGKSSKTYTQHKGLGKKLIKEALKTAQKNHYNKLSVISAVGTREYYRKLGFNDGELYQHKLI